MQYEVYTGLISVIYFEDVNGNIGPAQLKHEIELIAKRFNLYPPTTGILHYRIASTPIPPQNVSHGGYLWLGKILTLPNILRFALFRLR
jgi:hypothetical protein